MTVYSSLSYLQRHRYAEKQIQTAPASSLGISVVIPCFDEPDLLLTLQSLDACQAPRAGVEIIVVINAGSTASGEISSRNLRTLQEGRAWAGMPGRKFPCHFLWFPDLPPRHAGVGLARKIGMDEAVDRFTQNGNDHGIIVCLDADTTVAPDYLTEIENIFARHPRTDAVSIWFEHPLSGSQFSEDIYRGIVSYELFLRYYNQALLYAGFPHAVHAVGSAMAVSARAYQQQGGMNRRKAGEDFYFLHKFLPEGRVRRLHSTKVFPSPRPSDKVPFGTGRAIRNWLDEGAGEWMAYSPLIFAELKQWLMTAPDLYDSSDSEIPQTVAAFLQAESFSEKLSEIRRNVKDRPAFVKRFFHWFDGLKVLQYVHFARDHAYPDIPLSEAAVTLCEWVSGEIFPRDNLSLLHLYRQWELHGRFPLSPGYNQSPPENPVE